MATKSSKPEAVSPEAATSEAPPTEPVQCSHAEDPTKCETCAQVCTCSHVLGNHLYTRAQGDRGPCGDCSCDGFRRAP